MGNKIGPDGPGTALPFGPVEHTPGPWRACHNGHCSCGQVWSTTSDHPVARVLRGEWGDEYPAIRLSENGSTAEAYTAKIAYGSIDDAQAMANARLIASAPEMLEALRMVRDADDDCGRDGLQRIPSPARSRIDAAIAKAMGDAGGPTGQARSAVSSDPGPSISSQGGV